MSTDQQPRQEEFNPQENPQLPSKYTLTPQARVLLAMISEGEYTLVTDIPDEMDDHLSELMHLSLLKISELGNGKLELTKNGERAVDKRVAIAYPFGPNGTIRSYPDTLNTQTTAAGDALLRSQANNPSWLLGRSRSAWSPFFDSCMKVGIFKRLPASVNLQLHEEIRGCLAYYADKWESNRAAALATENIHFWMDVLDTQVREKIITLESVSLKNPIILDDGREVDKIYMDTDSVRCDIKDPLTGDLETNLDFLYMVTHNQKSQLLHELSK